MATDDYTLTGDTEKPWQSAKTGMAGQEMALVVYQPELSLLDDGGRRGDGDDDDPKPMWKHEDLAFVLVGQVQHVPLRVVTPESEETAHEIRPVYCYERPKITITYKRRRETPPVSNAVKRKIEQSLTQQVSYDNGDDLLVWYKELVRDRDRVVRQLRAHESRISVQKEYLKKMDAQLKKMLEASREKKLDKAVQKLASAPW